MVGENKVSLSHINRTYGLGAYIHYVTMGRTSSLDTVRPLCGFLDKTSFSLHCLPILRLLGLLRTP